LLQGCIISQTAASRPPVWHKLAAERNSFRAVKNQKIACDFLIFYRSSKFYLIPTKVGKAAKNFLEQSKRKIALRFLRFDCSSPVPAAKPLKLRELLFSQKKRPKRAAIPPLVFEHPIISG
jgi:hypothetical protein